MQALVFNYSSSGVNFIQEMTAQEKAVPTLVEAA